MRRWVSKVVALVVIFVLTLAATLLPLRLTAYFERQGSRGRHLLACLSCFAGGVFLAIYLLHMAPDAHELMHRSLVVPFRIAYPLTEVIIAAGIFMMLFAEKLVLKCSKRDRRRRRPPAGEGIVVEAKPLTAVNGTAAAPAPPPPPAGHSHVGGGGDLSGVRSLVLLLALSLHHVFEGVTVGLQRSSGAVWSLCAAIISHELVVGFSLGLQLVRAYGGRRSSVVIAAVACAAMTPVGVLAGIGVMETGSGDGTSQAVDIANGVLQSVATGVFIYVTFFEILAAEMTHADTSFSKLLCMLLGFVCIALLAFVPEDRSLGAATADYTRLANATNRTCT